MNSANGSTVADSAAVYDRVVRDARSSFGHILDDASVEQAAREAVDDLLVRNGARITTFVPVLALRRLREALEG
ncbi:MAG: hypothetical protein M3Y37_08895 [Chloroflexota bacterium]|jgi:hypothetical protein|nr:hypothetical protein [Chloroflexota bacterium]